ncbi:hypothetical protein, partial [Chelatococcus composti]
QFGRHGDRISYTTSRDIILLIQMGIVCAFARPTNKCRAGLADATAATFSANDRPSKGSADLTRVAHSPRILDSDVPGWTGD